MNLALISTIFSVLQQIVSFLIKYGPGLIVDAEAMVADLELAWKSATSGALITADQQTQIDAALERANTALAAAIADAAAQDAATQ